MALHRPTACVLQSAHGTQQLISKLGRCLAIDRCVTPTVGAELVPPRAVCQLRIQRAIGQQVIDGLGQRLRRARRHDQARCAVAVEPAHPREIGAHHRQRTGHGFELRQAEGFAAGRRGEYEQVTGAQVLDQPIFCDRASEVDPLRQAKAPGLRLQPLAPRAIAYDVDLAQDSGRRREQYFDPFVVAETAGRQNASVMWAGRRRAEGRGGIRLQGNSIGYDPHFRLQVHEDRRSLGIIGRAGDDRRGPAQDCTVQGIMQPAREIGAYIIVVQ